MAEHAKLGMRIGELQIRLDEAEFGTPVDFHGDPLGYEPSRRTLDKAVQAGDVSAVENICRQLLDELEPA